MVPATIDGFLFAALALLIGRIGGQERLLAAAAELAAEGGYDAVQMRDVAQRSGVAMATMYRYFSSKENLLATALGLG